MGKSGRRPGCSFLRSHDHDRYDLGKTEVGSMVDMGTPSDYGAGSSGYLCRLPDLAACNGKSCYHSALCFGIRNYRLY